MALKDDLIRISGMASAVLDGCNSVLSQPVASLNEVPPAIEALKSESVASGYTAGYDAGYGEGVTAGEANGFEAGTEYGKTAQYDAFWDAFQDKGDRTDYTGEFDKPYWNDATFRPKYPIVIAGNANQTFYNCGATALPVPLDTAGATSMNYFLCNSKFKALPAIDLRGVSRTATVSMALYNCPNLVSVDKVYLHGGPTSGCFERLSALTEIRFEGELVSDLDLHWSPLSRESIESVVAALSDGVSGKVLNISPDAAAAFTDEEWDALRDSKPTWAIVRNA